MTKKLIIVITVLVTLAAVVLVLVLLGDNDSQKTTRTDDAVTTSTAETAQEDFTDGDDRQPGNGLSENRGSGTIADTGGLDQPAANSDPVSSNDGKITVFSPQPSTILQPGDKLIGEADVEVVNFRLIDNTSGVISTGQLSVVNGRFSGTFDFVTTGTEGRLDVFVSSPVGLESSIIEIPIAF